MDEQHRRIIQEYIFNLEEAQDRAEELGLAHERLRQLQELLLAVLDTTSHGICLIREGLLVWCNKAMADIAGREQIELIGQPMHAFLSGHAGRSRLDEVFLNESPDKETLVEEVDFVHGSGRIVPCLVTGRPVEDRGSSKGYVLSFTDFRELREVQRALGVAYCDLEKAVVELSERNALLNKEIEERRRAEKALGISERKFRAIFDEAFQHIGLLNSKGTVLEINKSALDFCQTSESEVLGRPFWKTSWWAHSNEMQERLRRGVEKAAAGEFVRFEASHLGPGGKLYFMDFSLKPVRDETGKVALLIAEGRDVTERKQVQKELERYRDHLESLVAEHTMELRRNNELLREEILERKAAEEKYRSIFNNVAEGIFQVDPNGRFLSVNPALARFHGYASPEEMIESVTAAEVHLNSQSHAKLVQLLRRDGMVRNFETRFKRKDGEKIWVRLNAHVVRDKEGKIHHYEGTVQDISEQKKLQAQLLELGKMEAIGTLAGGIAHDFNNILMCIQGHASLMLYKTTPSDANHQSLKNIEAQVKSGSELTRQLLGFARKGKYEVNPVNVNEIIEKSLRLFGRTRREITLYTHYEENLACVEVDRGQLEQVLINLYLNAAQAMPVGGEIRIGTECVTLDRDFVMPFSARAGRYVRISVADTGVGMDEKTKSRIFEPFFTTKEMGRGVGLGLASVYGIVRNHSGFIDVQSEMGLGSCFNIYLPASEMTALENALPADELCRGVETILLVDDDEMLLDVNSNMLEALGYTIIAARSGEEAVAILREHQDRIDIVILDMIMPGMGGEDTFLWMKRINPRIKVLLSSGYSLQGQAERIIRQGCNAFIQKPFNLPELSKKIREVLDSDRSTELFLTYSLKKK